MPTKIKPNNQDGVIDAAGLIQGELKVLRDNNNAATGIRDRTGLLLLLLPATRYTGQDQRYERECAQKEDLTAFLLSSLESLAQPACDAGEVVKWLKTSISSFNELGQAFQIKAAQAAIALIESQARELDRETDLSNELAKRNAELQKRCEGYDKALGEIGDTKTNIDGSGKAWSELGRVVRLVKAEHTRLADSDEVKG